MYARNDIHARIRLPTHTHEHSQHGASSHAAHSGLGTSADRGGAVLRPFKSAPLKTQTDKVAEGELGGGLHGRTRGTIA